MSESMRGEVDCRHWLIVYPYIVNYRVQIKTVYVLVIRHGRRRQPKRFD
jgi:hypothetical protein